mgnify:CR=1 FL=1
MSIIRKVRRVERIFSELEMQTNELKKATGVHCLLGCGSCCTKPDIEASVLEFLPFAFDIFISGKADSFRKSINSLDSPICPIFQQTKKDEESGFVGGHCKQYANRGLICRLFSFSTTRDKNGDPRLTTCRFIKDQQPAQYETTLSYLASGKIVPVFTDYYGRLLQIDFRLGQEVLPINEAIKRALEEVLNYYQYRPYRGYKSKIA